jgi:anti-sigma factor RsiW
MTPCQHFRKHIDKYCEGDLDSLCIKKLEEHLKVCPRCQTLRGNIEQMRVCLKQLPDVKVSEGFNLLLRERIRREATGKSPAAYSSGGRLLVPALGIAVLVLVMGIGVSDQNPSFSSGSRGSQAVSGAHEDDSLPFRGRIQYVIEELPSASAVQVEGRNGSREASRSDSMAGSRPPVRVRAVPVSF